MYDACTCFGPMNMIQRKVSSIITIKLTRLSVLFQLSLNASLCCCLSYLKYDKHVGGKQESHSALFEEMHPKSCRASAFQNG